MKRRSLFQLASAALLAPFMKFLPPPRPVIEEIKVSIFESFSVFDPAAIRLMKFGVSLPISEEAIQRQFGKLTRE